MTGLKAVAFDWLWFAGTNGGGIWKVDLEAEDGPSEGMECVSSALSVSSY